MSHNRTEHRLEDLLADRALYGLDTSSADELDQLIRRSPEDNFDSYEIAAALLDLSMTRPEPLPETLYEKLSRQGHATLANSSGSQEILETENQPKRQHEKLRSVERAHHAGSESTGFSGENKNTNQAETSNPRPIKSQELVNKTRMRSLTRELVAWGCAAAIGFVAVGVWNNNAAELSQLRKQVAGLEDANQRINQNSATIQSANSELKDQKADLERTNRNLANTNNQQLAAIEDLKNRIRPDAEALYNRLADSDSSLKWNWSPTENSSTEATGNVVWNEKSQEGVMRFVNLEVNDPETSQYQLWIIEEAGRRHPVDGGVFDVTAKGEVFIPINAKLVAQNPVTFAITVEKPKGVVVSKQSNVPLIAKAPAE